MKAFISSLALVLWGSYAVLAQTKPNAFPSSDYFTNFTPQAPNKAALGSYGNVPINYYTCLPEVNLNLVTLTSRDISVPISVTYDATGVRLDDISGPVGIKWNLNAGGYVARQLNGLPDEHPTLGYWKFRNDLNASTINATGWVTISERYDIDCEPDEFVAYVAGRSIRFFIKDGIPVPIPRQEIRIEYKLSGNKISKFVVITEDGTRYTFGDDDNAIEERRVENLSIVTNFLFRYKNDKYRVHGQPIGQPDSAVHDWFYLWDVGIYGASYHVKSYDFYNSKWYLKSIESPSHDVITFTYAKDPLVTQKFVTQPVVTRKSPLTTMVEGFTYNNSNVCVTYSEFICMDHRDFTITHTDWQTPAYAAFSVSCPDHNFSCSDSYPQVVQNAQTNLYFSPHDYKVDPEGIFINQSLITESVIKLQNISSSSGNKVKFYSSSSREDLPNAIKYDKIELINMNGEVVKTINLKYSTVNASTTQNYMWLSEALTFNRISDITQWEILHADNALSYDESDINSTADPVGANAVFGKFCFEGMKIYNYRRLFLDAITESTSFGEQLLYGFIYSNRAALKRRITPMQDGAGFQRSSVVEETFTLSSGAKAMVTNASDPSVYRTVGTGNPTYGLLSRINYPTGGSTVFSYAYENLLNPRLTNVADYDEAGKVVRNRAIQVLENYNYGTTAVFTFYQNSKIPNSTASKRFKIVSSMPQNRTFNLTQGVSIAAKKVRVFNGPSADHSGYEDYTFSITNDLATPVFSIPKDLDAAGNELPQINNSNIFPFPKFQVRDHLRGLLEEHRIADKAGRTMRITKNFYDINPNGYQPPKLLGFIGGSFPYDGSTKYRYGRYALATDWITLNRTEEYAYDQSGTFDESKKITTVTSYTYDPVSLQVIQSEKKVDNDRMVTKTKFVTDPDFSFDTDCNAAWQGCLTACSNGDSNGAEACRNACDQAYDNCVTNPTSASPEVEAILTLRNFHQISSPVEIQTITERNGVTNLKNVVVFQYSDFGIANHIVKPSQVYALNASFAPTSFNSTKVDANGQLVKDSRLRLVHTYNSYDATNGNILLQTSLDGTTSKYEWDAALNNSLVKKSVVNEGSAGQQQSSYTHRPLIGVSSITDPNGIQSYFEYDASNRLHLTRDNSQNILDRYRYHLVAANANEPLTAAINVLSGKAVGIPTTFSAPIDAREFGTTTYSWSFGDDAIATSTSNTASHTYAQAGTYTVTLTKSNPEYGSASASTTIVVSAGPLVSICADGPIKADICRVVTGADTYGTCTDPSHRIWNYQTRLNATASGGCASSYTYAWDYKKANTSTWVLFGISAQVAAPFTASSGVNTADVRCRITDACGNSVTSSSITLEFFASSCAP